MRFSIRQNNDLAIDEHVSLALAAEAAGFDQYWVANDLFHRSALVVLPALACRTTRISLGVSILNPYTLNPAEIAMFAATMDELSKNRFLLGFAAGAADFLSWVGVEQTKPLAAMRESVTMIRRLLAGDIAAIEGTSWQWGEAAYLRFKPARVTPIYIGASGPHMLRLAGEIGDGLLPLLFPPEYYDVVKPLVDEGMARSALDRGRFDLVGSIWASVGTDVEESKRLLQEKIATFGGSLAPAILERLGLTPADFDTITEALVKDQDVDRASSLVTDDMLRIGVIGSIDVLIERLEPLVERGLRHISFGPPLGPDRHEAIHEIGARLIPYFRRQYR